MKNWKMVRNITLIILIFFLVFIGKIAIEEFLGGIPLIIDIIFLILSIIKIKRLKKEEMSK